LHVPIRVHWCRHCVRGALLLSRRLHLVERADEGVVANRHTRPRIGYAGLGGSGISRIGFECGAAGDRDKGDAEAYCSGGPHAAPASACSRKAAQAISRISSRTRPTS
jgi:hypothetical protein